MNKVRVVEIPFESVPLSPWSFHLAEQTLATIGLFGESYSWYPYLIIGSANVPSLFVAIEVVVDPRDYSFPPPTYSTTMRSRRSVSDLRLPGPAAQTVEFPFAALPLGAVEDSVVKAASVLVVLGLQIEAAEGLVAALGGP